MLDIKEGVQLHPRFYTDAIKPTVPRVGESDEGLFRLLDKAFFQHPIKTVEILFYRHGYYKGRLSSSTKHLIEVDYFDESIQRLGLHSATCFAVRGTWAFLPDKHFKSKSLLRTAFELKTGLPLRGLVEVIEHQNELRLRNDIKILADMREPKIFKWRKSSKQRLNAIANREDGKRSKIKALR